MAENERPQPSDVDAGRTGAEVTGARVAAPATSPRLTGAGHSWILPMTLVLSMAALAISIFVALNRDDEPHTGGAHTESVESAKDRTCAAAQVVQTAVGLQTKTELGTEPVAKHAVAANARLATLGGGHYLLDEVTAATPPDLAEQARALGNALVGLGIHQLAGETDDDPAQAVRLQAAETASARLAALCR
ncbi:hypothetical protein [Mycolicibacterium fallax]|uniref:Uncharacterized protein n=1 Tax=Mycolicibacterium fallax TaxID=1793 RepID=A0A1X1R933_MYCFA|nr:hypothetical protein [Mycolicibacterium fallax]ORV01590.1 hypothetical protein AWC04_13480 [Mycolicibacterium fallax]BBY99010.1 hypothetical protein MFAL_24770 [Mycolicibacterium fallax]HSA40623.1 hypothetical protein [Mycobacterium sp.]